MADKANSLSAKLHSLQCVVLLRKFVTFVFYQLKLLLFYYVDSLRRSITYYIGSVTDVSRCMQNYVLFQTEAKPS